tara:strand:+ start:135 stop:677 length:543 start_codon:yes stop_codon:yes gene_type:complete
MIRGKKVSLHAVEKEHLPILQNWRNDPEYRKYYREYRELTLSHKENWYKNKIVDDDTWQFFVVKPNKEDVVIGSCGLIYINWVHRTAEFSITIGEQNCRGKGYGSDTLRTLIKYGFEELNLNRIWCEVYDNNDAVEIYRHIGFKDEGRMRQTAYKNGKYLDSFLLSMLREDYEQIEGVSK